MEFQIGKYYAHRNFVDVIVKVIDLSYTDRGINIVVNWYNRGASGDKYQMTSTRDVIKIDGHLVKNWVEYTL
jgi:serine/threonine protein kinase HipA of HipAB toxin-antitoxin module